MQTNERKRSFTLTAVQKCHRKQTIFYAHCMKPSIHIAQVKVSHLANININSILKNGEKKNHENKNKNKMDFINLR